jgi:hypothetical protein
MINDDDEGHKGRDIQIHRDKRKTRQSIRLSHIQTKSKAVF